MLTFILGVTCFFFLWSANPVHGVLSLVVVGLTLAAGLLGQGLEFPALLIVLVYVGAVTVLFIFVVMMVNLRATPVSYLTAEAPGVWLVLAGLAGTGLTWGANPAGLFPSVLPHLEGYLNLETLGFHLYGTERVYFVFVVGLILFVAMVAAICLSLAGGENYRTQEFYSQIRRSNGVFTFVARPQRVQKSWWILPFTPVELLNEVVSLSVFPAVTLGAVSLLLFYLLRNPRWWVYSIGGFTLLWGFRWSQVTPTGVELLALGVSFVFFLRRAELLRFSLPGWSCGGALLGAALAGDGPAWAATDENEEDNRPEWQKNGYPSEDDFEEAVDERERFLWMLIIAGGTIILVAAFAYFYFGGTPPRLSVLQREDPPAGFTGPRGSFSPAERQARPPSGTSHWAIRAVRAYARYTLRRY